MTFDVLCEDCDDNSPDVGDGGIIGFPSLGTAKRGRRRIPENFGYIYEGFRAIGLLTQELDGYLLFLYRHAGHRLVVTADANFVYPGEDSKPWFRAARSITEGPERPAEGRRYVAAHFVASCEACGATLRSEHTDSVLDRPPHEVTLDEMDSFSERVVARLSADDFYRSAPFSEEDLGALAGFLKTHRTHHPQLAFARAQRRARTRLVEDDA